MKQSNNKTDLDTQPLIPAILGDKKGLVTGELSFLIFLILLVFLITIGFLFVTHRVDIL